MAKSKYETHVKDKLVLVEAWARDGLTDEQIAIKLGIATSTLNEYKKKYPEFSESLKKGKEIIDVQVENALLKRALGYDYDETYEYSNEEEIDGKKKTKKETKYYVKHCPPDTTAIIYWLKNRKAREWRDKREEEFDNNISISFDWR